MSTYSVCIEGKLLQVDPRRSVGKGGEADVFDMGQGRALKIFKSPDHPDLQSSLVEQRAARERLQEHQYKLRVFPESLPEQVISPRQLALDPNTQQILGYTMTLIQGAIVLHRYTQRQFRQQGVPSQTLVDIFRDLHSTVCKLHQAQVVIGDFNDLNILVKGNRAYLIDADSYQFSPFLCRMYTLPFLDPLLCDPQDTVPILAKPYLPASDWYAFTVMLMQCLLFVSPYGGVYRPKDPDRRIPHEARPLHRITVFHPEVRYPKPALPYEILPDELLHYFHQVFEQDRRGVFPGELLEHLQWTTCTTCGLEHGRPSCPHCLPSGAIQSKVIVRGSVVSTALFATQGVILQSAYQQGKLLWIYHEQGSFWREDRHPILKGELDPKLRFGLRSQQTLIGKDDQMIRLIPDHGPEPFRVDCYRHMPMFSVNAASTYWIRDGQLWKQGQLGPDYIGDVLSHQTQFWVGAAFGFGFYQAGRLTVAFLFDARVQGLNDQVCLPPWSGQLVDTTCYFSDDLCWLFLAIQEQNCLVHRCVVITATGQVVAQSKGTRGDGSWLSSLSGKCAAGGFLLVATDEGIVRVEPDQGDVVITKTFPDTEPFVDPNCQIWASPEGLYVVKRREIELIRLS